MKYQWIFSFIRGWFWIIGKSLRVPWVVSQTVLGTYAWTWWHDISGITESVDDDNGSVIYRNSIKLLNFTSLVEKSITPDTTWRVFFVNFLTFAYSPIRVNLVHLNVGFLRCFNFSDIYYIYMSIFVFWIVIFLITIVLKFRHRKNRIQT